MYLLTVQEADSLMCSDKFTDILICGKHYVTDQLKLIVEIKNEASFFTLFQLVKETLNSRKITILNKKLNLTNNTEYKVRLIEEGDTLINENYNFLMILGINKVNDAHYPIFLSYGEKGALEEAYVQGMLHILIKDFEYQTSKVINRDLDTSKILSADDIKSNILNIGQQNENE